MELNSLKMMRKVFERAEIAGRKMELSQLAHFKGPYFLDFLGLNKRERLTEGRI